MIQRLYNLKSYKREIKGSGYHNVYTLSNYRQCIDLSWVIPATSKSKIFAVYVPDSSVFEKRVVT